MQAVHWRTRGTREREDGWLREGEGVGGEREGEEGCSGELLRTQIKPRARA
jgi:hypothetical protein